MINAYVFNIGICVVYKGLGFVTRSYRFFVKLQR